MAKLTQEKISEIIEKYKVLKTYAAVSRATGVSPATVKKYVLENQAKVTEQEVQKDIFENVSFVERPLIFVRKLEDLDEDSLSLTEDELDFLKEI